MVRRRAVSVLVLSALLALSVACTRSNSEVETGGAPVASGGSSSGGSTDTGGGAAASGTAAGDFGTLKKVCGGGTKAQVAPDTVGVQGDTISLGVFSDPGQSARPGLNQELFDASDVFVDWCNSLGGINGFKLKANHHDAALFNVKPKMQEACLEDFFLVGGGVVFDDTGEPTRLGCLLPNDPGYVVSAASRGADLLVSINPASIQAVNWGMARTLNEKYPQAKGHIGYMTGNLPSLQLVNAQYQGAGEHFGWKTVYDAQYNAAGESTWTPYALAVKNAGVRGLYYTGEPENLGKLVAAFSQIGYKLDFIASTVNHYDVKLLDNAGKTFDNAPVYLEGQFSTFDQKPAAPTITEYLQLFQQFKPNGKSHAGLGLNAFSAWLLFAESLKQCSTISRKCVYEAMAKTSTWDAGGLQATANPASNKPGNCFTVIHATNTGFKIEPWKANDGIFNCDPANVVTIPTKLGDGATLASVGKSMADLK
jgi:hypothetical protein